MELQGAAQEFGCAAFESLKSLGAGGQRGAGGRGDAMQVLSLGSPGGVGEGGAGGGILGRGVIVVGGGEGGVWSLVP